MFNSGRLFLPFLIGGLLFSSDIRAGTFLIDGRAADLSGRTITNRHGMIGFVGDYFELSDGDHVLSLVGPHSDLLLLTIEVRGDLIQMIKTDFRQTDCGRVHDITWPTPSVTRNPVYPDVHHIKLKPVRYVPTEEIVPCASMARATCNEHKSIVEFRSVPSGGEIWFNRQKSSFRTNVTLSVPSCANADAVSTSVLVRMDGRVNCRKDLSLMPDAKLTVECAMRVPGE